MAAVLVVLARRRGGAPMDPSARRQAGGTGTLGAISVGFLRYIVAELALAVYPHPLRWAAAAVAGGLGCGGGWAWSASRWRTAGR